MLALKSRAFSPLDSSYVRERSFATLRMTTPSCHPELPFTSHKRGIDETWRSAFQTTAKDLAAPGVRSFAALRMTGLPPFWSRFLPTILCWGQDIRWIAPPGTSIVGAGEDVDVGMGPLWLPVRAHHHIPFPGIAP